jgi:tRNA-(ms[2]io[6]A)-hydroxylase
MLGVNKAATNAITIITHNSEHQDLVGFIGFKEEIDHFEQVHNIIVKRLETGSRTQR